MELHNLTFWFFGFELGLFNLTIFFLKIVQARMDPNGPGGYSNRIRVTHVEVCYAILGLVDVMIRVIWDFRI